MGAPLARTDNCASDMSNAQVGAALVNYGAVLLSGVRRLLVAHVISGISCLACDAPDTITDPSEQATRFGVQPCSMIKKELVNRELDVLEGQPDTFDHAGLI